MAEATVKGFFEGLPDKLNAKPEKIAGMNCVYQFRVTDAAWNVKLADGKVAVAEGEAPSPNCTVTMAEADFLDLVSGKLNGQMAFLTGKLKVAGDMGLALKLGIVHRVAGVPVRTGGSDPIQEAVRILAERRNAVALTGAGISVESGIPSFRGSQGMWAKYDPMEYATLHAFMQSPRKVWEMLTEMVSVCGGAVPNDAHKGLTALEELGMVRAVITQNVDGLHQAAGSRRVIEYHGNLDELLCVYCWKRYPTRDRWTPGTVPLCDCGEILKPNVVLFGEPIPWLAQEQAEEEARTCGVLLVIGTSAQVSPACDIPRIAKDAGAAVVEINPEPTSLTANVTDIHLRGNASEVLRRLLKNLLRDNDVPLPNQ